MTALILLLACAPAPRAVEVCNGEDDDADGSMDEDVRLTWYADGDGDGYGDGEREARGCAAPAGFVRDVGDCDDQDAAIHPGAVETCATTEDDDCDGSANAPGAAGCIDQWTDADGDGVGEGTPTCVCRGTGGAEVGGDCDPDDPDRGLDCAEGTVLALEGARVIEDDPDAHWSLAGRIVGASGEGLAMYQVGEVVGWAAVPAEGDVALSDVLATPVPAEAWRTSLSPVLGDLDGDGFTDVLSVPVRMQVTQYEEWIEVRPVPTLTFGPLDAATASWTVELDPVVLSSGAMSAFIADLDGDAAAEAWVVVSDRVPDSGGRGAWRLDASGVVTASVVDAGFGPASAWVLPLGDLDGDGSVDLGDLDTWTDTLGVHAGPFDAIPTAEAPVSVTGAGGPTPLGDLDADGYDDLAIHDPESDEGHVYLVRGAPLSGSLSAVAAARIGPEGEGTLSVTAGDLAADGTRELIVSDVDWPGGDDGDPSRGAVYVWHGLPLGVTDVRSADECVYGEAYESLGVAPTVLADGRLAVGARAEEADWATGVVWILDW